MAGAVGAVVPVTMLLVLVHIIGLDPATTLLHTVVAGSLKFIVDDSIIKFPRSKISLLPQSLVTKCFLTWSNEAENPLLEVPMPW